MRESASITPVVITDITPEYRTITTAPSLSITARRKRSPRPAAAGGSAKGLAKLLVFLSLLTAAPASAGPALMVNAYGTSLTQSACVEQARRILETVGLTGEIAPSTVSGSDKRKVTVGWYGQHPELNLTGVVECDARNGIGVYGTAGGDSTQTYELFLAIREQLLHARRQEPPAQRLAQPGTAGSDPASTGPAALALQGVGVTPQAPKREERR